MRRLNTLHDLRRYLAALVNTTESGEIDVKLSGKRRYLCSMLHRVIEGGDLEERLAKLEKQFANKGGKQ